MNQTQLMIHLRGTQFRIAAAALVLAVLALIVPAAAQGNQPQGQAAPPAQQDQAQPEEDEFKQIELTQGQIDAFIATDKEIQPITAKLKPDAEPSKEMIEQMEAVAKKNGFKDFDEYGDVGSTISFVFSGINPANKQYQPEELIKREIAAVNADKKIPAAEKKEILQELRDALTSMPKMEFPGNVDLVVKNYERLKPLMEQ
jgi:hypothetical protein